MKINSRKQQPSKKSAQNPSAEIVVIADDESDDSTGDASRQIVLYNPDVTVEEQSIVEVAEPEEDYASLYQDFLRPLRAIPNPVLPSIGAYTVQCAACFKWRVVPTKEKYEELRETICEELFVCARAREWHRVLSCEDPEDIAQDGSRLWAIDKPNIAQPPPGWDREVRIRGQGSSKFADVYYTSPSGKKLRSTVEIGRYLMDHPEYIRQGVNLSQFSFASPKPLDGNYVKKRIAPSSSTELPGFPELEQVSPLSWASPPSRRELLGEFDSSVPYSDELDRPEQFEPSAPPAKKKAARGEVGSSVPYSNELDCPEQSEPSAPPAKKKAARTGQSSRTTHPAPFLQSDIETL